MKNSHIIGISCALIVTLAVLVPVVANYSDDSTINVLVLDGQSNAEYWPYNDNRVDVAYVNENYGAPSHQIFYYGFPDSSINQTLNTDQCCLKYAYSDNAWNVGSYEAVLGYDLSNKIDGDILIINLAVGGKKISELSPGSYWGDRGSKIMDDALDEIKHQYAHVNMLGMIWIQGEADHDTPVNQYMTTFDKLVKSFKQYGIKEWYIVHTREYYGGSATIAQQILSINPHVTITSDFTESFTEENGQLVIGDPIHYSQMGRDIVARELVDLINPPEKHSQLPIISIIPVFIILGIILSVVKILIHKDD